MKTFKVLSIDWDYLVNATMKERVEMFPDGGSEKLPEVISRIVWSTRYASCPQLKDIGVDVDAMDILKEFISKNCFNAPIIVSDSHGSIWDAILRYKPKDSLIDVINVDFHHDMYVNDMGYVDCGNWVNCLFETRTQHENRKLKNANNHYYWVAREDSEDSITEECQRLNYMVKKDINFLKTLDDFECDLLFICRSGIWSPPHLDEEFMNFYDWCIDNTSDTQPCSVNDEVSCSRYTQEMKKDIQGQIEIFSEIRKECNNGKNLY